VIDDGSAAKAVLRASPTQQRASFKFGISLSRDARGEIPNWTGAGTACRPTRSGEDRAPLRGRGL